MENYIHKIPEVSGFVRDIYFRNYQCFETRKYICLMRARILILTNKSKKNME